MHHRGRQATRFWEGPRDAPRRPPSRVRRGPAVPSMPCWLVVSACCERSCSQRASRSKRGAEYDRPAVEEREDPRVERVGVHDLRARDRGDEPRRTDVRERLLVKGSAGRRARARRPGRGVSTQAACAGVGRPRKKRTAWGSALIAGLLRDQAIPDGSVHGKGGIQHDRDVPPGQLGNDPATVGFADGQVGDVLEATRDTSSAGTPAHARRRSSRRTRSGAVRPRSLGSRRPARGGRPGSTPDPTLRWRMRSDPAN